MASPILGSYGVSLHITVTVAPENVETFLEHLKPLIKLVSAEPDCTFTEFYSSAFEPGVITCVECWSKDLQWMGEVQAQKDYYKPFHAATEPLFIKPREVKVYNRMGPGYVASKKEHFA